MRKGSKNFWWMLSTTLVCLRSIPFCTPFSAAAGSSIPPSSTSSSSVKSGNGECSLPEQCDESDLRGNDNPTNERNMIQQQQQATKPNLITNSRMHILYGTAWKADQTSSLVYEALMHGFRFIDTACQPKHYNEPGVGAGWTEAAQELGLDRSDLYIQTKFTSVHGQDPNRIPYDERGSLEEQMTQSLHVSLKNLRTTYLDALVLHSPFKTSEKTLQAWKIMESFVAQGKVRKLGISNCYNYQDFLTIYEEAQVKPSVLQNRFYKESNFDTKLRAFCKEHGILYQSFWTLTANRKALGSRAVREIAAQKGLTPQTLMYAFMMALGHTPLDGTTDLGHMEEDVALWKRIEGGEEIFSGEGELREMAGLLGMPAL